MRPINLIVVHCTATPNGRWTTAADMDGWHKARGFRRDLAARKRFSPDLGHIGYHHVIYTNGAIANGRGYDEIGAHTSGHNKASLGIAMVGTDRFSAAQWESLRGLINALTQQQGLNPARYPSARVVGHRDLSPDQDGDGVIEPQEWLKTCPGFDVAAWRRGGMEPLTKHIFPEEVAP